MKTQRVMKKRVWTHSVMRNRSKPSLTTTVVSQNRKLRRKIILGKVGGGGWRGWQGDLLCMFIMGLGGWPKLSPFPFYELI